MLLSSYDNLVKIKKDKAKLQNGVELLVNSPQFGAAFESRFELISGKEKGKALKNLTELASICIWGLLKLNKSFSLIL